MVRHVYAVFLSILAFNERSTICLLFVESFSSLTATHAPWRRKVVACHVKNQRNRNNKRKPRSDDVMWVEKDLQNQRGLYPILGSDESGRGCVAGPVVAATVAILCESWEDYDPIPGVRDSKEVLPEERQTIYNQVVASPETYVWHVATRSNTAIDESNILQATMDCFQESIEQVVARLPETETAYSIVDGKKGPKLSVSVPSRPWVQADKEVYTVALASILAKVTRDEMSQEWHQLYPEYHFDANKGYATKDHVEAIHKHGPCPIHRLSFKTLKGR